MHLLKWEHSPHFVVACFLCQTINSMKQDLALPSNLLYSIGIEPCPVYNSLLWRTKKNSTVQDKSNTTIYIQSDVTSIPLPFSLSFPMLPEAGKPLSPPRGKALDLLTSGEQPSILLCFLSHSHSPRGVQEDKDSLICLTEPALTTQSTIWSSI